MVRAEAGGYDLLHTQSLGASVRMKALVGLWGMGVCILAVFSDNIASGLWAIV